MSSSVVDLAQDNFTEINEEVDMTNLAINNVRFDSVRDPDWGISGSTDGTPTGLSDQFCYDLPDSGFLGAVLCRAAPCFYGGARDFLF